MWGSRATRPRDGTCDAAHRGRASTQVVSDAKRPGPRVEPASRRRDLGAGARCGSVSSSSSLWVGAHVRNKHRRCARPAVIGSETACPAVLPGVRGDAPEVPDEGEVVVRAEGAIRRGPGPRLPSRAPCERPDDVGRGYGQREVESRGERGARVPDGRDGVRTPTGSSWTEH